MPSGYASNQFWNFGSTYEKGKTLARQKDDNANFIFPRPFQPDVYNPIRGRQLVDTRLQRGFIRGIYPSVLGGTDNPSAAKAKQRRLFFQFNPATIDRSVEMNAMVANPLLQDPSQIFQPVAGTAAFSFELTFNREAEVVSARNATTNLKGGGWATDTATPLTGSLDEYGTEAAHSDVASLGVLADLYVLDSIIGQSITPDTAQFIKAYFSAADNANQANANTTGTTTVTNPDGSTTSTQTKSDGTTVTTVTGTDGKKTITTGTTGESSSNFDATGFETNITKNFGNGAFLSPLPIRIVFSSLFMVEGFVESTSVRFAKFSKNYVPTVCAVNLTIRALYIGFAKEEAYLTTALKAAVKDMESERKANKSSQNAGKKIADTGTGFVYETTSIFKQRASAAGALRNTAVGYPHNFDSFYEFWNNYRSSNDFGTDIQFRGSSGYGIPEVTSRVAETLSQKVTKGEFTWSLDSSISLDEYLPDKVTLIQRLVQSPISYKTYSTSGGSMGDEVTNAKIVENANKTKDNQPPRFNRWNVELSDNGNQNGMPLFKDVKNIVKMTIQHNVTYTITQPDGTPFTGTTTLSASIFVTKTKTSSPGTGISWEEIDNGGLKFTILSNTTSTGWKDR